MEQFVHRKLGNESSRDLEQGVHAVPFLLQRISGQVSIHRDGKLRRNPLEKLQNMVIRLVRLVEAEPQ